MIREGREDDWPLIERWRAAHFERMKDRGSNRPVTGQTGFEDSAWMVYGDPPLAAMGFRDDGTFRHVTFLFSAPGKAGLRAGMILGRAIEAMSDSMGLEIRGSTDPENLDYLEHLLARGYEVTSVEFRRVPRAVEQQRAAAEPGGGLSDPGQYPAGTAEPE